MYIIMMRAMADLRYFIEDGLCMSCTQQMEESFKQMEKDSKDESLRSSV